MNSVRPWTLMRKTSNKDMQMRRYLRESEENVCQTCGGHKVICLDCLKKNKKYVFKKIKDVFDKNGIDLGLSIASYPPELKKNLDPSTLEKVDELVNDNFNEDEIYAILIQNSSSDGMRDESEGKVECAFSSYSFITILHDFENGSGEWMWETYGIEWNLVLIDEDYLRKETEEHGVCAQPGCGWFDTALMLIVDGNEVRIATEEDAKKFGIRKKIGENDVIEYI